MTCNESTSRCHVLDHTPLGYFQRISPPSPLLSPVERLDLPLSSTLQSSGVYAMLNKVSEGKSSVCRQPPRHDLKTPGWAELSIAPATRPVHLLRTSHTAQRARLFWMNMKSFHARHVSHDNVCLPCRLRFLRYTVLTKKRREGDLSHEKSYPHTGSDKVYISSRDNIMWVSMSTYMYVTSLSSISLLLKKRLRSRLRQSALSSSLPMRIGVLVDHEYYSVDKAKTRNLLDRTRPPLGFYVPLYLLYD